MDLIEPVKQLIQEVENATGKPVEFKEVSSDRLYGGGSMNVTRAFGKTPAHIIRHVHDVTFPQFFVSHECLHILRITSVPVDQRLTIKDNPKTVKNGFRILFGVTHDPFQIPKSAFATYNELRGLILSGTLSSGIQDLWVDQEILRRYPDTLISEELFEAYQEWSETKLNDDLNLDKSIFSDKCFEIINATNWGTLNIARSGFIQDSSKALALFDSHPDIVSLGHQLVDVVQKHSLSSYKNDMDIIDEWATILGIRSCYFWRNPETKKDVWVRN